MAINGTLQVKQVTKDKVVTNLSKYPEINVTVDWDNIVYNKNDDRIAIVTCNICTTRVTRNLKALCNQRYTCIGCSQLRYQTVCTALGWTYLSREGRSVTVKCNTCDSTLVTESTKLLLGNSPRCYGCINHRYNHIASNAGFEIIEKISNPDKVSSNFLLRCLRDDTKVIVSNSNLINGHFGCPQCREQTYRDILTTKGCEFIRLITNKGGTSEVIYKTQEGKVRIADVRQIRGHFITTDKTSWQKSCTVYLIINTTNGVNYYKIGISNNPEKRLKDLKLLGNSKVFTLESFPDRFGADKLESELHEELKQFKLDPTIAGEFTTAKRRVKRCGQIKRVHIKDGVTEWFIGQEVFQTLSARYNLKEENHEPNSNSTNQVNYSG